MSVQKTLLLIGLALIVIALLWPWLSKLPLGRLPGDIVIDRPNLKVYMPITSMILISLVVSALIWFFRR